VTNVLQGGRRSPPGPVIVGQLGIARPPLMIWFSVLRCVTGEDKVASFDGPVTGKAGVVHRLVGGFPVVKLREPQPPVEAYFLEFLTMN
jgi:hypothetical protein